MAKIKPEKMESETTEITTQDFDEYNIKVEVDPTLDVVIKQEPPDEDNDVITGLTSDWLPDDNTSQTAVKPNCNDLDASTSEATGASIAVECDTPKPSIASNNEDSDQSSVDKSLEPFCVFEMKEETEPLEFQETESIDPEPVDPEPVDPAFDLFRCEQCPQLFTSQRQVDFHLSFAHLLNCDKCDFKARNKKVLEIHLKRRHYNLKNYQCKICQVYTSSYDALRTHASVVHNIEKIFKCKMCAKEFRIKNSLVYHEKYVHTKARPFACEKCDKTYKTKMDRSAHIKRVHSSGKCQYHCKFCPKSFPSFIELEFHEKKIHTDPKPKKRRYITNLPVNKTVEQNIIPVTNVETQSLDNLEKDKSKLIDKKGEKVDHQSELIEHEAYSNVLKCEKCRRVYTSKVKLEKHTKTNACTYKCLFCTSAFILEKDYKDHLLCHTKSKTSEAKVQNKESDINIFPCSKCNIKFNQSVTLSRHMAAVHKEYPYVCQDCKNTFELEFVFFEHLKTHSPANVKIKCEKCSRNFKTQLNLDKHIEINLNRDICRTW